MQHAPFQFTQQAQQQAQHSENAFAGKTAVATGSLAHAMAGGANNGNIGNRAALADIGNRVTAQQQQGGAAKKAAVAVLQQRAAAHGLQQKHVLLQPAMITAADGAASPMDVDDDAVDVPLVDDKRDVKPSLAAAAAAAAAASSAAAAAAVPVSAVLAPAAMMPPRAAASSNPQAVSEYAQEIYEYQRNKEVVDAVPHAYMNSQPEITERMRAILMDWLVEVHEGFHFGHASMFLAAALVDRHLSRNQVPKNRLQLVGLAAFLVAAKVEEMRSPPVVDCVYVSDNSFTAQEIIQAERDMLRSADYNVLLVTAHSFAGYLCDVAQFSPSQRSLAYYLLYLALVDARSLQYAPSLQAAAAAYVAIKMTTTGSWTSELESASGYPKVALQNCALYLVSLRRAAPAGGAAAAAAGTSASAAVANKFAHRKHLSVASIPCPF